MKKIILITLILVPILSFGQEVKFEIEKLSKPEKLLYLQSYDNIYKNMILKDANLSKREVERDGIEFEYNILAKSEARDSLVNLGHNSFFNGMYQAYADHRPFVLSPDMIWLLINQGFARHVNANPEKLRKHFVDFSGQLTLVVDAENDLLNDTINWEEIFPQFTTQIAKHTGSELINTLTSDFSTTTAVERIASEVTIMEAMDPYFEFVVMYVVCGIPEITLLGTTEDWEKVLNKTKELGKYDLKWWTNELEPILNEFVNASKDEINKEFWRDMFKYHSQEAYGAPKIIDGWIVKFFPYDKDGKRNDLNKLIGGGSLPEEMVKVNLKYVKTDGIRTEETMLELWAGFIGLEQNPETYALTPQISWMVRIKDKDQKGLHKKLEANNIPSSEFEPKIDLRISDVPENLKKLDVIYSLGLHFIKDVFLPDWIKTKKIGKLFIEGNISNKETEKILDWFPNTEIDINGKKYNEGKNGWITVTDDEIPKHVLELDEIWILEVRRADFFNDKLVVPDELANIKIENFSLVDDTSNGNIEKLKRLLPDTNIYMNGLKIQ
ncbi:MAG: DUF4419 domain-containing protein [Proteiniphilum sp.]|nr:DUF4419 domain-containing protein [Proteiniphilum sp.]